VGFVVGRATLTGLGSLKGEGSFTSSFFA